MSCRDQKGQDQSDIKRPPPPIHATSSSLDGGIEDDMMSYWSDSAASNCDRVSSPASRAVYGVTRTIVGTQANSVQEEQDDDDDDDDDEEDTSSSTQRASSSKRNCNNTSNGGKNVRKRVMANERERERTKSLNQALEILRNRLPVPEAEKRSKIQTLRMAKEYIEFLTKFKKLSQQHPQTLTNNNEHSHNSDSPNLTVQHQYSKSLDSNQANSQNHHQQQQQQHSPDSPLTYKFYKFRLKSQNRND